MASVVDISKVYSVEEYIRAEETGTVRHEFHNGKLYPMPGETLLHNEICIQLLLLLKLALEPLGLKVYIESVKVKIENEDTYLYPDIVIIRNQPEKSNLRKEYVIYEPLLIAEVLSDSTRKYDLTDKFIQYQKISSLQYYLLVEPEKHLVIFYEKDNGGNWSAKTFTDLNDVINLAALSAQISLSEIYK